MSKQRKKESDQQGRRSRSRSFGRIKDWFGKRRKSIGSSDRSDGSLSPGPENRRRKVNSLGSVSASRHGVTKFCHPDPELTEALEALAPTPSKRLIDKFYFKFLPPESPFHWYPMKLCVDFAGLSGWQRLWVDKKLKHLDLSALRLSDNGLVALSYALRFNVWIRGLELQNSANFSDEGCAALCKTLSGSNSTIVKLNLGNNPQLKSGDGMRHICKLLKSQGCPIRTLYLDKIDLQGEAVFQLCKALKSNRSVRKLYLLGCSWTKRETVALSDVLSKNTKLVIYLPEKTIYKESLEPFVHSDQVQLVSKRNEAQRLRRLYAS